MAQHMGGSIAENHSPNGVRNLPCRQGDGSKNRIFVLYRGLVKSVNISDNIKGSRFPIVREGSYKYGKRENW